MTLPNAMTTSERHDHPAATLSRFSGDSFLLRSFLLFHEGDPFDPALLRESERNLRALDFIESASVTAGPLHDGVVDVAVTTADAFTTDVNLDFSNDGGRSLYDLDVTRKDIRGTGAAAGVHIANLRERRTASIELLDQALFRRT